MNKQQTIRAILVAAVFIFCGCNEKSSSDKTLVICGRDTVIFENGSIDVHGAHLSHGYNLKDGTFVIEVPTDCPDSLGWSFQIKNPSIYYDTANVLTIDSFGNIRTY